MKRIAALGVVLISVSGCNHIQYRSIAGDPAKTQATVITWKPDYSATVILPGQRACLQNALAIKSLELEAQANLSQAILALANAAESVVARGMEASSELARLEATIAQTVTVLGTSTERTTFLASGLFYVCQIAANQTLGEPETEALVRAVLLAAAQLPQPDVDAFDRPAADED